MDIHPVEGGGEFVVIEHEQVLARGTLPTLRRLSVRLASFLRSGRHDGILPSDDTRLATTWIGVRAAADKYQVPMRLIEKAIARGEITPAKRAERREWRFPESAFVSWLPTRRARGWQPGRKRKG